MSLSQSKNVTINRTTAFINSTPDWPAAIVKRMKTNMTTSLLLARSDLGTANWTKLGDPIIATNQNMSARDALQTDPHQFYRLQLRP